MLRVSLARSLLDSASNSLFSCIARYSYMCTIGFSCASCGINLILNNVNGIQSPWSSANLNRISVASRWGTFFTLFAQLIHYYGCTIDRYTVVLNTHEAIREAFVKHSADFADRPTFYVDKFMNPNNKGEYRTVSHVLMLMVSAYFNWRLWFGVVIKIDFKNHRSSNLY